jgi:uncharacterized protein (DUF2236 family)
MEGHMPATTPDRLPFLRPAKSVLVGQVRRVFNDTARGERPVQPSENALFASDSVTWRVHRDVVTMMIGGISSLMLQMLHPAVLAGVWDHSNFREDMAGRLRRTARFIATTTYADRTDAEALIAKVRKVHGFVHGTLPDGTPYSAQDPHLLAWVHVTEMWSFLAAWQRYGIAVTPAEEDRYFAEVAQIGTALGADPVPRSRAEAEALLAAYRPEMRFDDRTREVAQFVLAQPAPSLSMAPAQAAIFAAGVDLMPRWAQALHGRETAPLAIPAIRATAGLAARTLRWAFR